MPIKNGKKPKTQKGLYRKYDNLDYAAIHRLVFSRIVRLGWDPQLFAAFDSNVYTGMRNAHESERIGKKYQWIAFHEILARISDNFAFRGQWLSDDISKYKGPWQIYRRDVDPSCLSRPIEVSKNHGECWWSKVSYSNWRPTVADAQWIKMKTNLPNQKQLIQVNDKEKKTWLVLEGSFEWVQPLLPWEKRYDKTTRDVRYFLQSFLVKKQDLQEILDWTRNKEFVEHWIPESQNMRGVFLREFPMSTAYSDLFGPNSKKRWRRLQDNEWRETSFKVLETSENYHGGTSEYDCSANNAVRIKLPSREIHTMMHLKETADDGVFVDVDGEVVLMDPSAKEGGPSVLLTKKDKFLGLLRQNSYALLWMLRGQKSISGGPAHVSYFPGRLEVGGVYKMGGNAKLEGNAFSKFIPPKKI